MNWGSYRNSINDNECVIDSVRRSTMLISLCRRWTNWIGWCRSISVRSNRGYHYPQTSSRRVNSRRVSKEVWWRWRANSICDNRVVISVTRSQALILMIPIHIIGGARTLSWWSWPSSINLKEVFTAYKDNSRMIIMNWLMVLMICLLYKKDPRIWLLLRMPILLTPVCR